MGEKIEGIEIQPPDILKELPMDEYKVIICIKNYLAVARQLDSMNVRDYSIYDSGKAYPRNYRTFSISTKEKTEACKQYNIGYVAGAFDMFHVGHVNAAAQGKRTV